MSEIIVTVTGLSPLTANVTAGQMWSTGADKLLYSTGINTFAETTITAAARAFLAASDATAGRVLLDAPGLSSVNTFNQNQFVQKASGVSTIGASTLGGTAGDAAELQISNNGQTWALFTGYGSQVFNFYDVTHGLFPFKIDVNTPNNTFYCHSDGNISIGTDQDYAKLSVTGDILFVASVTAYNNGFYSRLVSNFAEEVLDLYVGTTKIFHTMEYNNPLSLYLDVNLRLVDGKNIILDTTAGSKIGTATTQKLGFWNATPIVQPVLPTGAGKTVDNIITILQNIGLVRQS